MTFNRDARIKDLEEMLAEAVSSRDEIQEKLRAEETIRRKLHNQIQELKGNIRVFCRVRPALSHESVDEGNKLAEIKFPDSSTEGREIECIEDKGESSMGKEIIKNYPFQFDKVTKNFYHATDAGVYSNGSQRRHIRRDFTISTIGIRRIQRLYLCLRSNWFWKDIYNVLSQGRNDPSSSPSNLHRRRIPQRKRLDI
jgi:Microtubule binding